MRHTTLFSIPGLLLAGSGMGQAVTISTGPSNADQVFYSLQNGIAATAPLAEWDLAFEIPGAGYAIHVNTAKGNRVFQTGVNVAGWATLTAPDEGAWTELQNSETTWSFGALNHGANPSDVSNYPNIPLGWGNYSLVTHTISGTKVFAIKFTDDSWKKLRINALAGGAYTFTYADLDGSNEVNGSIVKSSFAGKGFGYWNMTTNTALDREPPLAGWDLLFTRYLSDLGIWYGVAGALHNRSVEAAQLDGIDPLTVPQTAAVGLYSPDINVIGYDWKTFNMTTFQYVYPQDRAYFVKDVAGSIWKLIFTGYGGAANGNMTFTKELVSASGATDCEGVPGGPAMPGTPCNDGNPDTGHDTWRAGCVCAGVDCNGVVGGTAFIDGCSTCVGGTTGLTPCPQTCTTDLFFVHDAVTDFQQVGWAVYDANTHLEVASGGIGSNNPGSVPLCLPDGCFYLRVTDSNNDGIGGGYRLVTAGDFRRVIDNTGNFLSGGLSAIDNNEGFCLPLGTDQLIYTSCDKLWWRSGDHIVANENTAVSAVWVDGGANSQQSANSGYEFWFYDPNGGYTFRKLRMHDQGEGYANIGATRACHQKLDNWAAANNLPSGRLLNVKVRGMVHGVPAGNWGPACRFAVDAALAACPPTKLMDIPGDAEYSCGVTRTLARGQRIVARPVRGGKAYQWRFRSLEAPLAPPLMAVTTTYILNLSTVPGLVANGAQYNVEVRASMAGTGGPWCGTADPWGDVCLLTIVNPMIGDNEQSTLHTEDGGALMRVWPNPNRGDRLQLAIDALDEGVEEVVMDLYDLSGKRVLSRVIAGQSGPFSATIDLDGSVAGGIYAVHVTAGDRTWTQRLVLCSP